MSTPRALSDFRAVSDVSNNLDRCEDMLRKVRPLLSGSYRQIWDIQETRLSLKHY